MSDFQTNKKLNLLPLPYIGMYDLDLIYQTSDVELLYQILSKVNEIAQSQNIVIEDFQKILEWANEQIETYTKEQLQEWLENGTLENLIMKYGKAIKVYNTTEEMIASNDLMDGLIIKTLGYSFINDGGNALFYITNKKNDKEYQFLCNNKLYATIINTNNILCYGCKTNDDAIDNSVIINEILKYRNDIFIPNGIFTCQSSIILTKNCKIYGVNNSGYNNEQSTLKMIYNNGVYLPLIKISGCTNNNIIDDYNVNVNEYNINERCVIEDITLLGENKPKTAIIVQYAPNTLLKNITINNFINGIFMSKSWCSSLNDIIVINTKLPLWINNECNGISFKNLYLNCNNENYNLNDFLCDISPFNTLFTYDDNHLYDTCLYVGGGCYLSGNTLTLEHGYCAISCKGIISSNEINAELFRNYIIYLENGKVISNILTFWNNVSLQQLITYYYLNNSYLEILNMNHASSVTTYPYAIIENNGNNIINVFIGNTNIQHFGNQALTINIQFNFNVNSSSGFKKKLPSEINKNLFNKHNIYLDLDFNMDITDEYGLFLNFDNVRFINGVILRGLITIENIIYDCMFIPIDNNLVCYINSNNEWKTLTTPQLSKLSNIKIQGSLNI